RADWDELERLGNKGWGWDTILPAYRTIEANRLGPSPTRGTTGPLTISRVTETAPLCEAMIDAAATVGMARVEDVNETDDERIGSADVLRAAGVETRVDQPAVGARLREHRCFRLQCQLTENLGYNKQLSTATGQGVAALKYLVTHKGPLAGPSYDLVGFLKSNAAASRVDGQALLAPLSVASADASKNPTVEREPGVQ